MSSDKSLETLAVKLGLCNNLHSAGDVLLVRKARKRRKKTHCFNNYSSDNSTTFPDTYPVSLGKKHFKIVPVTSFSETLVRFLCKVQEQI